LFSLSSSLRCILGHLIILYLIEYLLSDFRAIIYIVTIVW
jgi:hypothetical protein